MRETSRHPLPILRADLRGYVLEEYAVDGFQDRADLSEEARIRIARWAKRFLPSEVSDSQRELLLRDETRTPTPSASLIAALREAERKS